MSVRIPAEWINNSKGVAEMRRLFICGIIFLKSSETFCVLIRLIGERIKKNLSERSKSMDNGASSYRRFLDGDDKGLAEIVRDYSDGLILYLNGVVNNISIAE